jgi:hypothetical protein
LFFTQSPSGTNQTSRLGAGKPTLARLPFLGKHDWGESSTQSCFPVMTDCGAEILKLTAGRGLVASSAHIFLAGLLV